MFHVPEHLRIIKGSGFYNTTAEDGNNGAFVLTFKREPFKPSTLYVIASDGMGWEHVSAHIKGKARCPTWDEMCFIKGTFWDPDDVVMQLHPRESEYVSCHPYTLHLWRPTNKEIPTPLSILVGPRKITAHV